MGSLPGPAAKGPSLRPGLMESPFKGKIERVELVRILIPLGKEHLVSTSSQNCESSLQLSNLFRRGIVWGIDDGSARQLETFWVESPVRVEWLPVPTDAFFETLWVQGIFQEINVACGINISDYEEAILPFEKIASAQKVLRETKAIDGKVLDFCQRFEGALASALASKRNVFFVF